MRNAFAKIICYLAIFWLCAVQSVNATSYPMIYENVTDTGIVCEIQGDIVDGKLPLAQSKAIKSQVCTAAAAIAKKRGFKNVIVIELNDSRLIDSSRINVGISCNVLKLADGHYVMSITAKLFRSGFRDPISMPNPAWVISITPNKPLKATTLNDALVKAMQF